jgi:RNA polymerase sigma-70 factor (ECF subfamily)
VIGTLDSAVADLLSEARQGRGGALGQLLERYRNYLTVLAELKVGGWLRGKVDAPDVVQDVFLAAARDFGQFRGTTEAELLGWLRRILACELADLGRHHTAARRDARLERRLADELDQSSRALDGGLAAPVSSPSQQAVRRERAVIVADALKGLPEDYARVVALHHLEGLTFPEVAERMGRSLDSVKQLWMRALGKIKRAVEGSL